jgi:hypothetical protein
VRFADGIETLSVVSLGHWPLFAMACKHAGLPLRRNYGSLLREARSAKAAEWRRVTVSAKRYLFYAIYPPVVPRPTMTQHYVKLAFWLSTIDHRSRPNEWRFRA